MRMLLSLAMLSLLGAAAFTQAPVPKGEAPQIGLASAVEKDGKVIIEIFELRRFPLGDRGLGECSRSKERHHHEREEHAHRTPPRAWHLGSVHGSSGSVMAKGPDDGHGNEGRS